MLRIVGAAVLLLSSHTVLGQETAFLYQGELLQNSAPADGLFDFQVSLFDVASGSVPVAPDEVLVDQPVSRGVFFVDLDFGDAILTAPELWLEVRVRAVGQAGFTLLTPRWRIDPAARSALAELADFDSVDSSSIVAGGVTREDIAVDAVGSAQIGPLSVGNEQIQGGAVGSNELQNRGVNAIHIAANAVGADEIAADAVTREKIGFAAVGSSEIAVDAVGPSEIALNGVGVSEIADGAVGSSEIAIAAVGSSELAGGAVGLAEINSSEIQRRISGTCPSGQWIQEIRSDGSVLCGIDALGIQAFGSPTVSDLTASLGNGSENLVLGTFSDRLCQLSRVQLDELDNANETGRCRLFVTGGFWVLEAFVTPGRDGRANCKAICQPILTTP